MVMPLRKGILLVEKNTDGRSLKGQKLASCFYAMETSASNQGHINKLEASTIAQDQPPPSADFQPTLRQWLPYQVKRFDKQVHSSANHSPMTT